jgi:hypothetical protein
MRESQSIQINKSDRKINNEMQNEIKRMKREYLTICVWQPRQSSILQELSSKEAPDLDLLDF